MADLSIPDNALLITHPRIYLDARGAHTDALLVHEGCVIATGAAARQAPHARHLDASGAGACLFPALTDAHIHLWELGMRVGLVDLKGSRSPQEVLDRLEQRVITDPPSGWIQGHGWDEHQWPRGATLSIDALDARFPDTPVCLYRVDHHAALVNREALRRADMLHMTGIEGGRIVRDARGEPTGLLIDEALTLLDDAIPREDQRELEEVFIQKANMLRTFGISCAHMAWTSLRGERMAQRLFDEGRLPIRLFCMLDVNDEELPERLLRGPFHDPRGRFSSRCIKFFADGAMGSKGALMLDPFLDGTLGLEVTSRARMLEEVPRLVSEGWQVATHAIGDAGARAVLDAYERAEAPHARLRLEHAQIMHPDDIARLRELQVIASVQPIHMYSDSPWADEVLQPHQLERLYQWRALQDATTIAAGSDYPIDDPNPWHGIATFLTRVNAAGTCWQPEQVLTRQEALAAYTSGAAFAAGWEDVLGQLHEGFEADVIALSHDPFSCSTEELWGMEARFVTPNLARQE